MTEAFPRTLSTAQDAVGVAALLERAAKRAPAFGNDYRALVALAQRYTDYAAALRETVAEDEPEVVEEQAGLL